jgi:ActR/RegA family two-component response regulator
MSQSARRLVLLCEDDDIVAEVLGRSLRHRGFEVERLPTPEAALDRLASAPPRVALLLADHHLARGGTGDDMVRAARLVQPSLGIVVIAGGGRPSPSCPEGAHLLSKPFPEPALWEVVERATEADEEESASPQPGG